MKIKRFKRPKGKIEDLIEKLELELGCKLVATKADDEVGGYISTNADEIKVVLYDEDEPANFETGAYNNIPYNRGHKTSYKKISGDISNKLDTAIEKVSKKSDDIISI